MQHIGLSFCYFTVIEDGNVEGSPSHKERVHCLIHPRTTAHVVALQGTVGTSNVRIYRMVHNLKYNWKEGLIVYEEINRTYGVFLKKKTDYEMLLGSWDHNMQVLVTYNIYFESFICFL